MNERPDTAARGCGTCGLILLFCSWCLPAVVLYGISTTLAYTWAIVGALVGLVALGVLFDKTKADPPPDD